MYVRLGHVRTPGAFLEHFQFASRAVYRNFAKEGGRIWGMEKEGGAEADNSFV